DLGELLDPPGPRRPLEGEDSEREPGCLEVGAVGCEHGHLLARRVRERAELAVGAGRRVDAELFTELAARGRQRILGRGVELALRDRPGGGVLARPERAAHVRDEDLLARWPLTMQQDACALHDHASTLTRTGQALAHTARNRWHAARKPSTLARDGCVRSFAACAHAWPAPERRRDTTKGIVMVTSDTRPALSRRQLLRLAVGTTAAARRNT